MLSTKFDIHWSKNNIIKEKAENCIIFDGHVHFNFEFVKGMAASMIATLSKFWSSIDLL